MAAAAFWTIARTLKEKRLRMRAWAAAAWLRTARWPPMVGSLVLLFSGWRASVSKDVASVVLMPGAKSRMTSENSASSWKS